MWNYTFMIPSLLILITLLGFYLGRKRLPVRMNRTFLRLLAAHVLVVLFDYVSSRADENHAAFPGWALYALNGLYFAFFLLRAYIFYRFTVDLLELRGSRRQTHREALLWSLPFLASEALCLSSPLTGALFAIGAEGYARGPLYDVIHVCFFFYIALSLRRLRRSAGLLRSYDRYCVLAYNGVLLLGLLARMLMPSYLVMNTFCVVAILIIYLAFLNPDLVRSDPSDAFNMLGFRMLLAELVPGGSYRILGFVLQNYMYERSVLGGGQMDEAVSQISVFLLESFPGMTACYLRGGRFVLVAQGDASWEQARDVILARFRKPWIVNNAEAYLGVAFAYVDAASGLASADRVVNNLMLALENAMDSSNVEGGSVSLDIQEIDRKVDALQALERAIERNAVEVFLQPVVDSHSRKVVAAEALARIRDEEGRIIPPGLFIPIAEHRGYIHQLGEQVLDKTCEFIHDHDIEAMGMEWINVNLSPIQCLQQGLSRRFAEILDRWQVPAEKIHLEITEQSIVDYSRLQNQILALRHVGFQFVLDDYGSGYSNLTRVKHYPFINIKLDMEVVWGYFKDRDGLLPHLVQGFKQMDMSITAEGIETQAMADVLTEIGSDYLQGFLISKPIPMEEFVKRYGGGETGGNRQ